MMYCDYCGEKIQEDGTAYENDHTGYLVCENCLNENTKELLLYDMTKKRIEGDMLLNMEKEGEF